MQQLRSYQWEQTEKVFDAIDAGYNRIVWTSPGGSGKTTVIAEIVRRLLETGKKVLILADAIELVEQLYERVANHCDLSFEYIGVERSTLHLAAGNRVVVAMVQTIRRPVRLKQIVEWEPDAVIVDEAHVSASNGYKLVYEALGVYRGKCLQIGTTATLKRNDKVCLAAAKDPTLRINPPGPSYMIEDKETKRERPALPDEAIYEYHCSDYGLLQAVMDGWLVEPRGRTLPAPIDLTKLKTSKILKNPLSEPDFNIGELAKEVDREDVNDTIVSAWLQHAAGRPTIGYCCSVHHAEALATKFTAAGIPSASVDGTTPEDDRARTLRNLRDGNVLVVCNYGVYGKGVDVPNVGCILVARPTKSWSLYVQWVYRGTRVLPGVLDSLQEGVPEERLLAIESSGKPYCIVLDLVGNSGRHKPCTLPVILDLPADLNLEGRGVLEAYQLLERNKENRGRVVAEHPKTFTQLEVRLKEVDLLKDVKARSKSKWRATGEGYSYSKVPPGYAAVMAVEGEVATLEIANGERLLFNTTKRYTGDIAVYLDSAEDKIRKVIEDEKKRIQSEGVDRGTTKRLTQKQINVLHNAGYNDHAIDRMPYARARWAIGRAMENYRNNQTIG